MKTFQQYLAEDTRTASGRNNQGTTTGDVDIAQLNSFKKVELFLPSPKELKQRRKVRTKKKLKQTFFLPGERNPRR